MKKTLLVLGGSVVAAFALDKLNEHIQHKAFIQGLRDSVVHEREYGRLKPDKSF